MTARPRADSPLSRHLAVFCMDMGGADPLVRRSRGRNLSSHPIKAIGLVTATLHTERGEPRVSYEGTDVMAAATPMDEATILHSLALEIGLLKEPLIVTCGGRRWMLPVLRCRALVHGVPMRFPCPDLLPGQPSGQRPGLVDLEDVLDENGAATLLRSPELYIPFPVPCSAPNQAVDPAARVERSALAVYKAYLRCLRYFGQMSDCEWRRSCEDLCARHDPVREPSS